MRTSNYLLATLKETPSDAEVISHKLMLRAGMVRQVAAGIYNWLPLGLRVLQKVESIVREEMDKSGALEVLLPGVQPAELWQESGRWEDYGPELLRLKDRHKREFCLGPTHEEVITTLVKNEIRSYRQLPLNLYQIQTKFRDEVRPRFGIMRGREFIMKDAYSFDVTKQGLQKAYDIMYQAYERIFTRLGLEFSAVEADTGTIGGSSSHEFHVLADSGEDDIAFCKALNFAANVETIDLPAPGEARAQAREKMVEVDTPGVKTIEQLATALNIPASQTVKTLIVKGKDGLVALVVRGDHELNSVKAEALENVISPIAFASQEEIKQAIGTEPGSIGPVGLNLPMVIDQSVAVMTDFVCGANKPDKHLTGVNWERDLPVPKIADLRQAQQGDPCPGAKNGETISIRRGIEVGHVFQLGRKYSRAMNAYCLNEQGEKVLLYMGCYGIGVSRIVAAAIEQNHDEAGIIWPEAIAPFSVCIVTIGYNRSEKVKHAADNLYQQLVELGIEVLLDDRNERPGVLFSDMELIGIPHRITIGEKSLDKGQMEYKHRAADESEAVEVDQIIDFLNSKIV